MVTFASNDYLGLTQHPAVIAAAHVALERYGAGSGAARLIVGGRPIHEDLEIGLASWTGRAAALLFPTGFQANLGVLGALARSAEGTVIYSDELNHASIIDGVRLANAEVVVYRHADPTHLAELLAARPGRPSIVVTDSVFSMDGDLAPLDELAERCGRHDALLVVDEAHGVLGPHAPDGAVVVGTLSKAFGSVGGYVAADRDVVDLCINSARSFIFTTAGAPADAAAARESLRILVSAEGEQLRAQLRANVDLLLPGHPSPIVPVLLGSEERAVEVSAALLDRGMLVPAIRPPTVPPGTCRLRIAVSAAHAPDDLLRLRDTLDELGVAPVTRAVDDPISDPVPEPAGPGTLVVVAGTATEVGKTWVSVRLIEHLRSEGVTLSARKPAQSFDEGDVGTDAELLAAASGDDPNLVCPPHRWYPVAMAPPMAADVLGREPVFLADLVAETNASWHDTRLTGGVAQVGLVELAGGPWSPAAHDGDGIGLTERLGPHLIVLVADAGLGTINAVRPAVQKLCEVAPVITVLNRYDESVELHRRNRDWLVELVGVDLVVSVEELSDRVLALL